MWGPERARLQAPAASALPALHVLLAEDDTPSLCIISRLLTACGYRVTLARNGREALDLLGSERGASVDLILSDLLMPEVSGMELVGQVVRTRKGVPVVVMSSESGKDFIAQALQAGAADYLIKPVKRSAVTMLWQHVWRSAGWGGLPPKGRDGDSGASGASSPETFFEPLSAAELAAPGRAGLDGWEAWPPPRPRYGAAGAAGVRAPVLLPCMRVSLEIEPLDLTPRSVFDFPDAGKEEAACPQPPPPALAAPPPWRADAPAKAEGGDTAVWAANRRAALEKFRAKRKLRKYDKCVRYESRRRLAEARPRVRGMFCKAEVAAAHAAELAAGAARAGGAKRGDKWTAP